eukprot:1214579-Rhodomonas_salina.2
MPLSLVPVLTLLALLEQHARCHGHRLTEREGHACAGTSSTASTRQHLRPPQAPPSTCTPTSERRATGQGPRVEEGGGGRELSEAAPCLASLGGLMCHYQPELASQVWAPREPTNHAAVLSHVRDVPTHTRRKQPPASTLDSVCGGRASRASACLEITCGVARRSRVKEGLHSADGAALEHDFDAPRVHTRVRQQPLHHPLRQLPRPLVLLLLRPLPPKVSTAATNSSTAAMNGGRPAPPPPWHPLRCSRALSPALLLLCQTFLLLLLLLLRAVVDGRSAPHPLLHYPLAVPTQHCFRLLVLRGPCVVAAVQLLREVLLPLVLRCSPAVLRLRLRLLAAMLETLLRPRQRPARTAVHFELPAR